MTQSVRLIARFHQPTVHARFQGDHLTASTGLPVVREYIGAEEYDGSYEVIPLAWDDQSLPTTNKILRHDVHIQEIPYYEVSNPSGGMTVNIG